MNEQRAKTKDELVISDWWLVISENFWKLLKLKKLGKLTGSGVRVPGFEFH